MTPETTPGRLMRPVLTISTGPGLAGELVLPAVDGPMRFAR